MLTKLRGELLCLGEGGDRLREGGDCLGEGSECLGEGGDGMEKGGNLIWRKLKEKVENGVCLTTRSRSIS